MQIITAARLLPGFLGPAAGEWCAPLSLVQVFGLLSWLRFNAAQVNFSARNAGRVEIGRSWAALPIMSKGEGADASQLTQLTREMTLENTVRASCALAKKTRPIGKPCLHVRGPSSRPPLRASCMRVQVFRMVCY